MIRRCNGKTRLLPRKAAAHPLAGEESPLTKEQFTAEMLACLRAALTLRPGARAEDIVKFIFQGMLGVGHLLGSEEQVQGHIARETAEHPSDPEEPLAEPVSPDWVRLNLRRAKADGLTPRVIARLMLSAPAQTAFTRSDVLRACAEYAAQAGQPAVAEAAERLRDPHWLPSHSDAYRARYRPAYRLIPAEWTPLLPAIARIAHAAAGQGRTLVTLDGPCASGKTTLAERLASVLDAAVLHTDDFVVPHAQKTPERLAVPGGNCDWERLTAEVLAPWKAGGAGLFRRYDCRGDRLRDPEPMPAQSVLILEGSYCNLPAIRALADVHLFMATPEPVRRQRLIARESPGSLAMFDRRWIPLENAYFEAYGLPDENCIVIKIHAVKGKSSSYSRNNERRTFHHSEGGE